MDTEMNTMNFIFEARGIHGLRFSVRPYSVAPKFISNTEASPDAILICARPTKSILSAYKTGDAPKLVVLVGNPVGGVNGCPELPKFLSWAKKNGSTVAVIPPHISRQIRLPADTPGSLGEIIDQSFVYEFFSTIGGTLRPNKASDWAASKAFCIRIGAANIKTAAMTLTSLGHRASHDELNTAVTLAVQHQELSEREGHQKTDGPNLDKEMSDAVNALRNSEAIHYTSQARQFAMQHFPIETVTDPVIKSRNINIRLVTFKFVALLHCCNGEIPYVNIQTQGAGVLQCHKSSLNLDTSVVRSSAVEKFRTTMRFVPLRSPAYDPLAALVVERFAYGATPPVPDETFDITAAQKWVREFITTTDLSFNKPWRIDLHTDPAEECDDSVLALGLMRHWGPKIDLHAFLSGGKLHPHERLARYLIPMAESILPPQVKHKK